MRVLIFARNTIAHPHPGGMEAVLATLAASLVEEGNTLALVTTLGQLDHGTGSEHPYERTWQVPGTRVGRYSRAWWEGTHAPGPWDTWRPDIVLGIGDAGGAYATRVDRRVPFIIQSHGTPLMEATSAWRSASPKGAAQAALNLLRLRSRIRFYRTADSVWAVGEELKGNIERLRKQPDVLYMPNAVDEVAFRFDQERRERTRKKLSIPTNSHVTLFAGRLDKQKGAAIAIKMLGNSTAEDSVLLIAGSGAEEHNLRRLVRRRGLIDRVKFIGRVERDQVSELMSASDLFVLPTKRSEGMPMSILEAAAAGLPVLTTPTASVPREIEATGRISIRSLSNTSAWHHLAEGHTVANERLSYLPAMYGIATYGTRHHQELRRTANEYAAQSAV